MDEADSFLQHFGKKGMRWGVRNTSTPGAAGASKPGKSQPSFLSKHKKAIAAGGVIAGAAVAGAILNHYANAQVSTINKNAKSFIEARSIIEQRYQTELKTIRPMSMHQKQRAQLFRRQNNFDIRNVAQATKTPLDQLNNPRIGVEVPKLAKMLGKANKLDSKYVFKK